MKNRVIVLMIAIVCLFSGNVVFAVDSKSDLGDGIIAYCYDDYSFTCFEECGRGCHIICGTCPYPKDRYGLMTGKVYYSTSYTDTGGVIQRSGDLIAFVAKDGTLGIYNINTGKAKYLPVKNKLYQSKIDWKKLPVVTWTIKSFDGKRAFLYIENTTYTQEMKKKYEGKEKKLCGGKDVEFPIITGERYILEKNIADGKEIIKPSPICDDAALYGH